MFLHPAGVVVRQAFIRKKHLHPFLVSTRNYPNVRQTIPVAGIQVSLELENEARELFIVWRDFKRLSFSWREMVDIHLLGHQS